MRAHISTTILYANAPAIGAGLVQMSVSSRDERIAADVTTSVASDPDALLSFALTTTTSGLASHCSKEGAQPPRRIQAGW